MSEEINISLSIKQINHIKVLKEDVFELNKYPSFSLLIDGLEEILKKFDKANTNICLLERTKLYATSLFGGLFLKANVSSFDCSPRSADVRGSYNSHLVKNNDFINYNKIIDLPQDDISKLPKNKFDIIFIPNLVHHFKNQKTLFDSCYKSLKQGGTILIFEPTFREIHQTPHDYIRYTPYGIEEALKDSSLIPLECIETGDSFEAINYILNVMKAKREDDEFISWCDNLILNIEQYKVGQKDIVKKHSRFPTAFLSYGKK